MADKRESVFIVGSEPKTRDLAPWSDFDHDIWVLNEAGSIGWPKRISAVYQLHPPAVYRNPKNTNDSEHWAWLQQKHEFPIYLREEDPDVPSGVRFPIEEVRELLSGNFYLFPGDAKKERAVDDFFTSTFPFLIGHAIVQGYKEMHITGVEQASGTEYELQKECLLFWIGFAAGHGLKVVMHSMISTFEKPVYAYDGDQIAIPVEYMQDRADMLNAQWEAYEKRSKNLAKLLNKAVRAGDFQGVSDLYAERQDVLAEQGVISGALGQAEGFVSWLKSIEEETGIPAIIDRQMCERTAGRAAQKAEELKAQMYAAAGKAEHTWEVWSAYYQEEEFRPAAEKQMLAHMEKAHGYCYDSAAMQGIYDECTHYMREIDSRIQAAGGHRTLESMKAQGMVTTVIAPKPDMGEKAAQNGR